MHLRLDGVNSFRKTIKLPFHTSVKVFGLNFQVLYPSFIDSATHDHILKEFLESMPNKEVSFYLLEIKEKCYYKNGKKKTYSRTARVNKKEMVSEIIRMLLVHSSVYLGRRYHVDNISKVVSLIKETFNGKYIELSFSENHTKKRKFEAQGTHFSGKQFTFHCGIVQAGRPKYVYYLSDGTTHNSFVAHQVLTDIITKWGIENETIIIKSNSAPTQYKTKYAFHLMQKLSDMYNTHIIRSYQAAGHGKDLADAMYNFCVKPILHRDEFAFNALFYD